VLRAANRHGSYLGAGLTGGFSETP
jgi:hypothetical protein